MIDNVNFLLHNLKTKDLDYIDIISIATPKRVYMIYVEIENYSLLGILVDSNYNCDSIRNDTTEKLIAL